MTGSKPALWGSSSSDGNTIPRLCTWDEKIQRAIVEVQARIQAVYLDAVFRVSQREDPAGIYIDAYTDAEDSFCVFDLVNDWLVDLSVDTGLSIHVIPLLKTLIQV